MYVYCCNPDNRGARNTASSCILGSLRAAYPSLCWWSLAVFVWYLSAAHITLCLSAV